MILMRGRTTCWSGLTLQSYNLPRPCLGKFRKRDNWGFFAILLLMISSLKNKVPKKVLNKNFYRFAFSFVAVVAGVLVLILLIGVGVDV